MTPVERLQAAIEKLERLDLQQDAAARELALTALTILAVLYSFVVCTVIWAVWG